MLVCYWTTTVHTVHAYSVRSVIGGVKSTLRTELSIIVLLYMKTVSFAPCGLN